MVKKKAKKVAPERWQRVAHNLQRLRRARGIATVNDLIDAMNKEDIEVNPSYMRRLESANAPFGSEMEQRFVQFYKVDISEFYRPVALSDKDTEIELVRNMLHGLDIQQIQRIRDLIPILFGGLNAEERAGEDTHVPGEKKSA